MTGVEALVWCVAIVCATILLLAILATLAGGGRRGGGHQPRGRRLEGGPPPGGGGVARVGGHRADVPLDELRPIPDGKRGIDSFDVPPPPVSTDRRSVTALHDDFPD